MKTRIFLILLFSSIAFAQQADTLFQQGNELYKEEKFAQAVDKYTSVLDQGFESPELYFNLGNAYFKEQQIGMAIVCFERALKLEPRDPDIAYNLQLAQLRVVDKIPVPPPFFLLKVWRIIKDALSIHQLSVLTLALWFILAIVIILWMLVRKPVLMNFSRIVFTPILLLFLFVTFLFFVRLHEQKSVQEAIVVATRVDVTSSPALSATQVFALHEGVKVYITDQTGEFVRIRLTDGKTGWLQANKVIKI